MKKAIRVALKLLIGVNLCSIAALEAAGNGGVERITLPSIMGGPIRDGSTIYIPVEKNAKKTKR